MVTVVVSTTEAAAQACDGASTLLDKLLTEVCNERFHIFLRHLGVSSLHDALLENSFTIDAGGKFTVVQLAVAVEVVLAKELLEIFLGEGHAHLGASLLELCEVYGSTVLQVEELEHLQQASLFANGAFAPLDHFVFKLALEVGSY